MNSRWARVARGTLVSFFSVFVAAFSHSAAGGVAPGGVGLALSLTFATLACIAVAGKKISVPRLSLAVVASQLSFHAMFSLGLATPARFEQASHHGPVTLASGIGTGGVHTGHGDGAMWLSHAIAAVVTIVVLWRGERAAWTVLSIAVERLVSVLFGAVMPLPIQGNAVASGVSTAARRPVRDDLGVVLSTLRHRGPPAAPGLFSFQSA